MTVNSSQSPVSGAGATGPSSTTVPAPSYMQPMNRPTAAVLTRQQHPQPPQVESQYMYVIILAMFCHARQNL